jgi:predicted TPR repeat methyltransferase
MFFDVKLLEKDDTAGDEWTVEYLDDGNVEEGVPESELTLAASPLDSPQPQRVAWWVCGQFLFPPPSKDVAFENVPHEVVPPVDERVEDCKTRQIEAQRTIVACNVLEYLGLLDKVRLQLVCSPWQDALLRPPNEWLVQQRAFVRGSREVLLLNHCNSNANRSGPISLLRPLKMRLPYRLLDLDVSFSDVGDSDMLKVVQICSSLTTLTATHCGALGRSPRCTWLQALWKGSHEFSGGCFARPHAGLVEGKAGAANFLPSLRILNVWKSYGLAECTAEFRLLDIRRADVCVVRPGFATVILPESWLLANVPALNHGPLHDGFTGTHIPRPDSGSSGALSILEHMFLPSPSLYLRIGPPDVPVSHDRVPERRCYICLSADSLRREQSELQQFLRRARARENDIGPDKTQQQILLLAASVASVDTVMAAQLASAALEVDDDFSRMSMVDVVAHLREKTHKMVDLTKNLAGEALKLAEEGTQAMAEVHQKSREYRSYLTMQEGMKRMEIARSRDEADRQKQLQLAEDMLVESLELFPGNEIASFKLAVLRGGDTTEHTMCPVVYTRDLFEQYAHNFEESLTSLKYTAPQRIADILHSQESMVTRVGCILSAPLLQAVAVQSRVNVLDCGCGTGWAGEFLKRVFGVSLRMVGVDVAPKMVDIAMSKHLDALYGHSELQIYDEGDVGECVQYLVDRRSRCEDGGREFDIIVAADLAPYIGDLQPFLAESKQSMRDDDGALLIFTVESLDAYSGTISTKDHGRLVNFASSSPLSPNSNTEAGYALLPTERYAHSLAYLQKVLADNGMIDAFVETTMLREDSGTPLQGYIVFAKLTQ